MWSYPLQRVHVQGLLGAIGQRVVLLVLHRTLGEKVVLLVLLVFQELSLMEVKLCLMMWMKKVKDLEL